MATPHITSKTTLCRLNECDRAEVFQCSFLGRPTSLAAVFNLALLLQRRNECAEAAIYWRRFLAIDSQSVAPDHPLTRTLVIHGYRSVQL